MPAFVLDAELYQVLGASLTSSLVVEVGMEG